MASLNSKEHLIQPQRQNESPPGEAAASSATQSNEDHRETPEKPEQRAESQQGSQSPSPEPDQKATVGKLNKKQKVKRHFRRFWIWYLVGFIIFLAILLPLLFKVIIPAIIQLVVNNQNLPISGGSLRAHSPTQMILSLDTSLDSPLPVNINPFSLSLYNQETTPYTPYLGIALPETHISGTTPILITNETVTIQNETELVKFLNMIFDQEQVEVSLRANPVVNLGELSSQPSLDKTISLPGLNNLYGVGVQSLELIMPPVNGINLKGSILLPNAGVLTLSLGNLTLNLYSGNLRLGLVHLYDVVLPPGNTTKDFEGQIYLKDIGTNLGPILAAQANALGKGVITLNATGNSTMVNGQHIKYLEAVLNSKSLSLDISVVTLLSDVLSGFLHGGKTSIVTVLSDILGNSTFVKNVVDNWNQTSHAAAMNQSQLATRVYEKRTISSESMAWNLFKLGIKMKMSGF